MSGSQLIETLSDSGSGLAEMLAERAEILNLSQAAHDAVLLPRDPGGINRAERAALAARMARANADPALAEHYRGLLRQAGDSPAHLAIADGADPAADIGARLRAIIRHVDLVTHSPKDATKADIAALVAAGLSEPDIVRLAELIAFVNYQARVIAGLRLLGTIA
ncbi:CMD domain-containing protein [Bosea sp. NPDC055332]